MNALMKEIPEIPMTPIHTCSDVHAYINAQSYTIMLLRGTGKTAMDTCTHYMTGTRLIFIVLLMFAAEEGKGQ